MVMDDADYYRIKADLDDVGERIGRVFTAIDDIKRKLQS